MSALAAFRQFAEREQLTGGPDHHRALAARAAALAGDPHTLLWRVLCYVATYEIHTGAQIWTAWPAPDRIVYQPQTMVSWVREAWPRLLWRRERRAARTVEKLATALVSCAAFAVRHGAKAADYSYDTWWDVAMKELRFFGRYALIKVFETWRRAGAPVAPAPDIRPAGGWSPRAALGHIYPESALWLIEGGDRRETLGAVNELAGQLKADVLPDATWETVEILLCNFHVASTGRDEYPGRRLDTDLGNYYESHARWHGRAADALDFLAWRRELFPVTCLGEVQGWRARRRELGACWADHGYFWCDALYDYHASRLNLAEPVARAKSAA